MEKLPKKMKRLVVLETTAGASFADLKDYKVGICSVVIGVEYIIPLHQVAVEEVDLPVPGPGQVLVKMVAAAVNPSDEGDLRKASKEGGNPKGVKLPAVFGNEGCGVVVGSGGGVMAARMVGKKVGVASRDGGTWQVDVMYIVLCIRKLSYIELIHKIKPR